MRNDLLSLAFDIIKDRRANNERKKDEKEKKAFSIKEIDLSFKDFKSLEQEKLKSDAYSIPFKKEKELSDKKKVYLDSLKKFNFSQDDFKTNYTCPKCKDTGYTNGKICDCVISVYKKLLQETKNKTNYFTFDNFKRETKEDENILNFGKNIVEKFPLKKTNTITIAGNTGVGKTVISQCIANGVLEKGYLVCFVSSCELIQTCLKYHTSPMTMRDGMLDEFFDSDLLIIDDLGTEAMLNNVTKEYLLMILSERNQKGKNIIFTTNLNQEQILSRYGERFFSRLNNKQSSLYKVLTGKDKRLK